MKRGIIAAIILILLLIGLVIWMYRSALSRDTGIVPSEEMSEELSNALEGRVLVWTTMANVPLEFNAGARNGNGILHSFGVPGFLLPNDFDIWRQPVRDEWNLASVTLSGDLSEADVRFYTFDQGSFLNLVVSADGKYVIATHRLDHQANIVRFSTDNGDSEVIALSPSFDQWPSCNSDGSVVLFHSYRGNNPGGDLYIAIKDENSNDGWRIVKLTDNPDVTYQWPKISADANCCVAVENPVGEGSSGGKVILWPLYGEVLGEPEYLTDADSMIQFPSLSASGNRCCWESGGGYLSLWTATEGVGTEGGIRRIDTSPDSSVISYWTSQPTITADGKFIVFRDVRRESGEARIGIYDIDNQSTSYYEGCGGQMIFPSMSNQVGGDNDQ